MAIPKWRYREHLLKLLCKWLDVKMNTRHLVCCITNKYANFSPTGELPKDRALVQIRTMKGDYLYVTSYKSFPKSSRRSTALTSFYFLRRADSINDLFKLLTNVKSVEIEDGISLNRKSMVSWPQFANEADLKLQLVLAGKWIDMK